MLTNVPLLHKLTSTSKIGKIFISVVIVAISLGSLTGFLLAKSDNADLTLTATAPEKKPTKPQQDTRTFRDFAEGKIAKKPEPKNGADYSEGTHILVREGAVPVALTSSVVDLSKYEGKKVKVYGETQKAVKEGWLMDVGRVEEQN